MPHELHHAGYLISDDPARLDADAIHAYLSRSYWAEGIPRDVVARALANSLCVGIYSGGTMPVASSADTSATPKSAARPGQQVGLVRAISDYTTFAYLCDVYVLEPHRGLGLGKAAMRLLTSHPRLQDLRRQQLVTQDAHGLYAQFGFSVVAHPERHMEKRDPDVYERLARRGSR